MTVAVNNSIDNVLAMVDQAAVAYHHPELLDAVAAARVSDAVVVVAGEFKRGKSTLVNALIGGAASPTHDDISTAVPILFRHSDVLEVIAHVDEGIVPFAIAQLPAWTTETGAEVSRAKMVEVGFARMPIGTSLVDTPGMGGLSSRPLLSLLGTLPSAAAHLVIVISAGRPMTRSELELCRLATGLGRAVTVAVNKIDLFPQWREVVDLTHDLLADQQLGSVAVMPVSALLARQGQTDKDSEIVQASGVDELAVAVGLRSGRDDRLRRVGLWAVGRMVDGFEVEAAALADDESFQTARERARAERDAADERRQAMMRWAATFGDAMSDLTADSDHSWRARSRELQRDFDTAIDGLDPATAWAEFEPQVYARTVGAVVSNWAELHDRFTAAANDVAELLGIGRPDDAEWGDVTTMDLLAVDASLEIGIASKADRAQSAMRATYSSMGMVGAMTSIAGLALAAPVTVVASALLGRKAFRDERTRQVVQRRAQAKAATHRYLDEVSFLFGKELRDTVRIRQRSLRQQLATEAELAVRSASNALAALDRLAPLDDSGRQRRLVDVQAELGRLGQLRERLMAAGVANGTA